MTDRDIDKLREISYKIDPPTDYAEGVPNFGFHNRFRVRDHFLGIDSEKFAITPAEPHETVTLTPGTHGEKIKDSKYVILTGLGYPTLDDALTAGRKWRQVLISIFSRMGVSCDIGDDSEGNLHPHQVTDYLKGMYDLGPSDVVYQDRIGLLIFDAKTKPRFFFGTVDAVVLSPPGPQPEAVKGAQDRYCGDWSDELKLAYTLVHSALADSNQETKFILFVTAIEALIPYRKREDALSALLEVLKPDADGHTEYDEDTRESVKKLLDTSQYNSVRQYGLKLAARLSGNYDGKTSKKYFDEVYSTRSALAHGNLRNMPHLSEQALGKQQGELRRFVLDILESWTANPTFDNASSTGDGTAESSPPQA